jgi:hypothetical protein
MPRCPRKSDQPSVKSKSFRSRVPEPEVLRIIREVSVRDDAGKLTSRQIDQIIKAARLEKSKI